MPRYGILVAEDGDDISSSHQKRLDSSKKYFKYKKTYDIKFPLPAAPVGTSIDKVIDFTFNSDGSSLGFIPAYEFYVKAHNGNWAIPVPQSPTNYEGSLPDYPFFKKDEYVTDTKFHIHLYVNNLVSGGQPTYNYPAYEATIRLIVTFDDLATL